MKSNIYYDDEEGIDEFADVPRWIGWIYVAMLTAIMYLVVKPMDAYRAFRRLHPIVKGLVWSALSGVGIGLLIVFTIYLLLEY